MIDFTYTIDDMLLTTPGKRMRYLRDSLKIGQEDFAEELRKRGVKRAQKSLISRIENDDVTPSVEVLEASAKVLNTTMDWLRCMPWAGDDDDWARPDIYNGPHYFSQEADEAARAIDAMSLADRRRAIEAIKQLDLLDWAARERQRLFDFVMDSIGRKSTNLRRQVEDELGNDLNILGALGANSDEDANQV